MVHDQEEPPLINELGFAIQPGTHTFCGLRKEVVCDSNYKKLHHELIGVPSSLFLIHTRDVQRSIDPQFLSQLGTLTLTNDNLGYN